MQINLLENLDAEGMRQFPPGEMKSFLALKSLIKGVRNSRVYCTEYCLQLTSESLETAIQTGFNRHLYACATGLQHIQECLTLIYTF